MLLLLLRWAACVEAAVSIRTSRIYLTIPWTTCSFLAAIGWRSVQNREFLLCSCRSFFILFTPTKPNPPPTGTFPLRVLSARYRSVFASFFFPFYHSNGLATCSPKRTGTWRNLFWAAKRFCNLDTFWSVPHQSIETSPPLSVELVSPAPPARVGN